MARRSGLLEGAGGAQDHLHDAAMQEPEPANPAAPAPDVPGVGAIVDYTVVVRGGPDVPTLIDGLQSNSW